MSTVLLAATPGDSLETIETSGVSTGHALYTSSVIELNIDQAAVINEGGSTRQLTKEEVLLIMNLFSQWIVRHSWPYASS